MCHSISVNVGHCQFIVSQLSVDVSQCQSLQSMSVSVSHSQSVSVTVSQCQSLSVSVSQCQLMCGHLSTEKEVCCCRDIRHWPLRTSVRPSLNVITPLPRVLLITCHESHSLALAAQCVPTLSIHHCKPIVLLHCQTPE